MRERPSQQTQMLLKRGVPMAEAVFEHAIPTGPYHMRKPC